MWASQLKMFVSCILSERLCPMAEFGLYTYSSVFQPGLRKTYFFKKTPTHLGFFLGLKKSFFWIFKKKQDFVLFSKKTKKTF